MAGPCRTAKVAMLGNGDEILKLTVRRAVRHAIDNIYHTHTVYVFL